MTVFYRVKKISTILKTDSFCENSVVSINTKKEPTVPNLALKALEIISALKLKLHAHSQKESNLLVTKNPVLAFPD